MSTALTLELLRSALNRGELTSQALTAACLARIETANDSLGAFVTTFAPAAMDEARRSDGYLGAGRCRSPLEGIPLAVKDNIDIAGQETGGGSRLYAGQTATADALVVERLRAAGMIIVGKTHMQELAFGGWGTNAVLGTPRNPYDLQVHRVPGGSSSGSAVAVAARLVPAAIGTDTGGSIRIPAAVCGVVGLKTTMGQLPLAGVLPLAPSLDTVGSMTVTVSDAELLYGVLAGPNAGRANPDSAAPPRIGMLPDRELRDLDHEVHAAWKAGVEVLKKHGALFTEVSFGDTFETLVAKNGLLIASEGWRAHGERISAHPELMDAAVLARFLRGRDVSDAELAAAHDDQIAAQARVRQLLQHVDAVLTPAVPMPAIPVAAVDESVLPFNRYTRAVNFLGLCALTLPAGQSRDGLPLALQLIGLPHTERRLLQIGRLLESGLGHIPPPDLAALGL